VDSTPTTILHALNALVMIFLVLILNQINVSTVKTLGKDYPPSKYKRCKAYVKIDKRLSNK
jgi:hypothetical protein